MEAIYSLVLSLFIALIGLFGVGSTSVEEDVSDLNDSVEVVEVIDGDTVKVLIEGKVESVRYIGMDTPERYRDKDPECYALEATERNRELLVNGEVQLVSGVEDRDKYSRLLRHVYVDGVLINEVLLEEGYAKTMSIYPNITKADQYKEAQNRAKKK